MINDKLTIERLKEELINKFNNVDFDSALMDVKAFINDNDRFIDSFRKDIFISTVDLIIAY